MTVEVGLVELSDAIEAVREQLIAAQIEGRTSAAGQALGFTVGKVSIEFAGELTTTVGGSAGVKFWVVSAEAKADRVSRASHKIVVELIPHAPGGSGFEVHDNIDAPPPA